jgi:plasmid maintenance system antidote protein VapI
MKLAEYLTTKGINRQEFARRLSVEPSTVTRLINGERKPSVELAAQIERETEGNVGLQDWSAAPEPEPPSAERSAA